MSKFEVIVLPIDKVENHPNADRLSLNHIRGYTVVSNKNEDGSHRYHEGQLVAYVPLNALLTHRLMQKKGYWDVEKDIGLLGGPNHDMVTPISLRGVLSHGLIFPADKVDEFYYLENADGHKRLVKEGDDVTSFLHIMELRDWYTSIGGKWPALDPLRSAIGFSIEETKKFPTMLVGQEVFITELLHGVGCTIGYDRALSDPYIVTSAPLGEAKYRFKKDEVNVYTELAHPVLVAIDRYLEEMPGIEEIYIHGVIIGPGIQDLTYGLEKPVFVAHDVRMKFMGGGPEALPTGFVGKRKFELFAWMGINSVPVIEPSPDTPLPLENNSSAIGGGLRKGIVITSKEQNFSLKVLSEKFLLRKKGTNFK